MQLPRRGLILDADGKIQWVWEHNDPTREFNSLPPSVVRLDGTIGPPPPDAVILDCDAEFEAGDMELVHRSFADVRVKKNVANQWEFFLLVQAKDAQGKDIIVEVPHPIEAIRAARKKAKEPKP